jgi:protein-disulfide isomerase
MAYGVLPALLGGCAMTTGQPECRPPAGPISEASPAGQALAADGAFGDKVRQYLTNNPKVIGDILSANPEMVVGAQRAMNQKQADERRLKQTRAIAENHDALFADAAAPILTPHGGAAPGHNPTVTIVEFFDVECPFCKAAEPVLQQLLDEDPDVRVVLKEFPILGPVSEIGALYELAAHAENEAKFPAFHAALMADKTQEHQLTEDHIKELAKGAGFDPERLQADSKRPDYKAIVDANRALAEKLLINGTPGIVAGDQAATGRLTIEGLRSVVIAARVHDKRAASQRASS